jgi:cysteinyl-tRNA synthetase
VLRLHDTATGTVAPVDLRDRHSVGLYVCGPTVYGAPHVGHGRFTLVYDVLRRYLEFRGLPVRHVSNITDIDDKIIRRANDERRGWQEVAAECEAEWWAAMDAMGVLRPKFIPRATDFVAEMVELIGELEQRGIAYETSDGVYLAAAEVPGYGLLSHQSIESRRAGARVELGEEKRDPIDFALWKKAKPDEPTWPSPWGAGRPGWHTECVVMSLALLGEGFDLHGGGQDLIFPHHENERAQAVALGRDFARHWMHNGLVTVGGEKMSKSLNNFTTLADLLAHTDARSYRLLVLRSHYRSPVEVNAETLDAAASALGRLDALAARFADVEVPDSPELAAMAERERELFIARMDDDLDTAGALAGLFEATRRANAAADAGDAAAGAAGAAVVVDLLSALGITAGSPDGAPEERVLALVRRRDAARAGRDFAAADALRIELEALGYRVEDTPSGTRVRR